mmetsp:Transcript_12075/g.12141  ORF Transcript_12075/g.12141 Transcript_12075/m.12141 type:complete len:327 (+) Transcript_12075:173-1153(+)
MGLTALLDTVLTIFLSFSAVHSLRIGTLLQHDGAKSIKFSLKQSFVTRRTFAALLIPISVFSCSPSIICLADDFRAAGTVVVDEGETARIYQKARQTENDGDFNDAQKLYEQVVQVQPEFIDAWSNLGNVLTTKGNLDQALLCYKKAISLSPPKNELWVILVNKASIELSTGQTEMALNDLEIAEKVGGRQQVILTNRAVAYSNLNRWQEASDIFETVISSADRNALPWWLRYSMSLLETGRGTEAAAYLQRTLNRFPDETECKAFAVALYSTLGSKQEAQRYWVKLSNEDRIKFMKPDYISSTLQWGPKASKGFKDFLASRQANI